MNSFDSTLRLALTDIEAKGLLRHGRVIEAIHGTRVIMGGREIQNFSSNDYLGLSTHPALAEAMSAGAARWGSGSTASRLICGTTQEHLALEEELAAAKGTEAALVFSTGMAAATGSIPALVGKGDVVILDKLAHACLIDGARASEAMLRVFPHNHCERLESHLKWARKVFPKGRVMIITESVFSMDGDLAPLEEIVALKERYGAILFLDEAHAVGVRGAGVKGLAGELRLGDQVQIQMGTFGKALGVSGGYIAGSRILVDYLLNKARSFIFSTAPSPAVAAACRASLRIVQSPEGAALHERLQGNIALLSSMLQLSQIPQSAITPCLLGSEERALVVAAQLLEDGFYVPAIRYPTVARNRARLRLTITATHESDQIRALANVLMAIPPDADSQGKRGKGYKTL
jgi:glycine C-acetyltransferase/8-amino-7-oxononanoate synthase